MDVSVLILTLNEETNIAKCIESVSWSNDIHVFDSFSTDHTVDIARSLGAKITQRRFDSWSAHQNWGLQNIAFKYSWVFYIDADEVPNPELVDSIRIATQGKGEKVAYRIQRRDYFMGRWLKHTQGSIYLMRLFRPDKMRYERLVNPISLPQGPTGKLMGYINHYPFSKGISQWFERHNSYSSFEAEQIIENRQKQQRFNFLHAFICSNYEQRRFNQKELFYRMPLRPVIKFFYLYAFHKGILDGVSGLTYSVLQAIYEYMTVLKVRERQRRQRGLSL